MEQFRQLLRQAVALRAKRVVLSPGSFAQISLDGTVNIEVKEVGLFEATSMGPLTSFLFPNLQGQVATDLVHGVLQIPQLGSLQLLGCPASSGMTISIYFPDASSIYTNDLAKLSVSDSSAQVPPPPRSDIKPIEKAVQVATPPPEARAPSESNDEPLTFVLNRKKASAEGHASGGLPQSVLPNSEPRHPAPIPFTIPEPPATGSLVADPLSLSQLDGISESVSSVGVEPAFEIAQPLYNECVLPELNQEVIAPVANFPISDAFKVKEPSMASMPVFTVAKPNQDYVGVNVPGVQPTPQLDQYPVSLPATDQSALLPINFSSNSVGEDVISHGGNPIDEILTTMVKQKASDLHLTVGQPIILRIHGDIVRTQSEELTPDAMEQLVMPTLPRRGKTEFSKLNDTDYAYELQGVGRFRINLFRDRNGVGAVMRHIPSQILSAETLNLPPAIMNFCKLNKGLVVVTGPTGSGKSTTLAAMVDWINKNRKEHILTIEDPIEFVHNQHQCLVNQREVHKHTGSFSRALKAALREDPDIILIGEMRDLETISIAIETAETGHLVFGTLHTTTAVSTVSRIVDLFPADRQAQIRTMLSSSLRGVVTQTLLKKIGGGRIAAHEILVVNDAVSAMIREGKIHTVANHMMTQKNEGNQLLNEALFKLIGDGLIDPQEALFKSVDKNDFILSAARRNVKLAG